MWINDKETVSFCSGGSFGDGFNYYESPGEGYFVPLQCSKCGEMVPYYVQTSNSDEVYEEIVKIMQDDNWSFKNEIVICDMCSDGE
jgi:hypothetical protein